MPGSTEVASMPIMTRDLHSLDADVRRSVHTMSEVTGDRRAFARLLRRELAVLAESFRFRATVGLVLGLMIVSALIHATRHRAEVESYQETLAEYEALLETATVAQLAIIPHPAVKPPWKLAFLVDGGQSRGPNVYRQPLSSWLEPELESRHAVNRRLSPSEPLDWLFLIRVVFSLSAFVLSYDALCGQRQRALLRMVLSYPVARWQVVAAKVMAVWGTLAAPFVVGAPLCLLILRFLGGISFSPAEWLKISMVAILALWALAVFALIGLLVSAWSRESARSLATLALIWITAVVVVPAVADLLVQTLRPLRTGSEVDARMEEIKQQVESAGPGTLRPRELAQADNFAREREAARIQQQRRDLQDGERRRLIEGRFEQRQLSRRLASISPTSLIQDLALRCAGSGAYRDRAFFQQAWEHSSRLAARVEALDEADSESPHVWFIETLMSKSPVAAGDVPLFEFQEIDPVLGLRGSARQLATLALTTLILGLSVLAAFAREDVG